MSPAGKRPGANPDSASRADLGSCPQLPRPHAGGRPGSQRCWGPARWGRGLAGSLRGRGRRLLHKQGVRGPGGALRPVRRAGRVSSPASPAARFQQAVDHTWIVQHRFGRGREGPCPGGGHRLPGAPVSWCPASDEQPLSPRPWWGSVAPANLHQAARRVERPV